MPSVQPADPILQDFLLRIRGIRSRIRQLTLFGSRARGDHRLESDYDILVVVPRKEPEVLDLLYEAVLEVLLTHGRLISLKVVPEAEFIRLRELQTPFMTHIAVEGKPLG